MRNTIKLLTIVCFFSMCIEQNAVSQEGAKVNALSADSPEFAHVQKVLKKRAPRGNQKEPKILSAVEIPAPSCFAGWRFFKVNYVPALPPGTDVAVPLLEGTVAIRGTDEEFMLPHSGDYSEFGKFLNYNKVSVHNSEDARNVLNAFGKLYGKKIDEAPEKQGEGHYAVRSRKKPPGGEAIGAPSISVRTKSDGTIESFGIQRDTK